MKLSIQQSGGKGDEWAVFFLAAEPACGMIGLWLSVVGRRGDDGSRSMATYPRHACSQFANLSVNQTSGRGLTVRFISSSEARIPGPILIATMPSMTVLAGDASRIFCESASVFASGHVSKDRITEDRLAQEGSNRSTRHGDLPGLCENATRHRSPAKLSAVAALKRIGRALPPGCGGSEVSLARKSRLTT